MATQLKNAWEAAGGADGASIESNVQAAKNTGGLRYLLPGSWEAPENAAPNVGAGFFAALDRVSQAVFQGATSLEKFLLDLSGSAVFPNTLPTIEAAGNAVLEEAAETISDAGKLIEDWLLDLERATKVCMPVGHRARHHRSDFECLTFFDLVDKARTFGFKLLMDLPAYFSDALEAVAGRDTYAGTLLRQASQLLEDMSWVMDSRRLAAHLREWIEARMVGVSGVPKKRVDGMSMGGPNAAPPSWFTDNLGPYLPEVFTTTLWPKLSNILWQLADGFVNQIPAMVEELALDFMDPWYNIYKSDWPNIWNAFKLFPTDPEVATVDLKTALLDAAGRLEFAFSIRLWLATIVVGAIGGAGVGAAVTGSAGYAAVEAIGLGMTIATIETDLLRIRILLPRVWDSAYTKEQREKAIGDICGAAFRIGVMVLMMGLAFVAARLASMVGNTAKKLFKEADFNNLIEDFAQDVLDLNLNTTANADKLDRLNDVAAKTHADAAADGVKTGLDPELGNGIDKAKQKKQGSLVDPAPVPLATASFKTADGTEHTVKIWEDANGVRFLTLCTSCGLLKRGLEYARTAAIAKGNHDLVGDLDKMLDHAQDLINNRKNDSGLVEEIGAIRDEAKYLIEKHGEESATFLASVAEEGTHTIPNILHLEDALAADNLLDLKPPSSVTDQAGWNDLVKKYDDLGYRLSTVKAKNNAGVDVETDLPKIEFKQYWREAGGPKLFYNQDTARIEIDTRRAHGGSDRLSKGNHIKNWEVANGRARPANHQGHHILPDSIAKKHFLFKEGWKERGLYDVDRASNVEMLPYTTDAAKAAGTTNLPIHRGSHPQWNLFAESVADDHLIKWAQNKGLVSGNSTPAAPDPAWVKNPPMTDADLQKLYRDIETELAAEMKLKKHWDSEGKLK